MNRIGIKKADDALSDGIVFSFYSMVGEIKMNIFKLLLPSSEFCSLEI